MLFKQCSFYTKWKLKLQLGVLLAAKALIFEHNNIMSTSSIESLTLDTKDGSKEQTQEENNEVLKVLEEKITMIDPKNTSGDSEAISNFLSSKKEVKLYMALLVIRIVAFVLCLIAFSVLSANEQRVLVNEEITNWYDFSGFSVKTPYEFHWYDYDEFKYTFSANVIGCLYSGLQIFYLLKYLITKNHTINPKFQGYFNVVIDQILAYVLMSASSSAATAAHFFKSYWTEHGAHKFIEMADASVSMSFFAFVTFALASLVSGFILFRFT